jgi:hypothetical protein
VESGVLASIERVVMHAVQEIRESVVSKTPISDEGRQTALERTVTELIAEGWRPETKPDFERRRHLGT